MCVHHPFFLPSRGEKKEIASLELVSVRIVAAQSTLVKGTFVTHSTNLFRFGAKTTTKRLDRGQTLQAKFTIHVSRSEINLSRGKFESRCEFKCLPSAYNSFFKDFASPLFTLRRTFTAPFGCSAFHSAKTRSPAACFVSPSVTVLSLAVPTKRL